MHTDPFAAQSHINLLHLGAGLDGAGHDGAAPDAGTSREGSSIEESSSELFQEEDADTASWSETEALTWALIDEVIEPAEHKKLEQSLIGSETARREYVDVIGFHTTLVDYFRDRRAS